MNLDSHRALLLQNSPPPEEEETVHPISSVKIDDYVLNKVVKLVDRNECFTVKDVSKPNPICSPFNFVAFHLRSEAA